MPLSCDPRGPQGPSQSDELDVFGDESRRWEPVGPNSPESIAWIMARNPQESANTKVLLESFEWRSIGHPLPVSLGSLSAARETGSTPTWWLGSTT